eukprot:m.351064 g.351064  ORF g.351064 m.351064 type:complete len:141 (-) comp16165_c0_seq1:66-488(-)
MQLFVSQWKLNSEQWPAIPRPITCMQTQARSSNDVHTTTVMFVTDVQTSCDASIFQTPATNILPTHHKYEQPFACQKAQRARWLSNWQATPVSSQAATQQPHTLAIKSTKQTTNQPTKKTQKLTASQKKCFKIEKKRGCG